MPTKQQLTEDELINILIDLKSEHKTLGNTLQALASKHEGRYEVRRAYDIAKDLKVVS